MNIGLCGLGKAGKQFIDFINNRDDYNLVSVLCRNTSLTVGKTVTEVTKLKTKNEIIIKKIADFNNNDKIDIIVDFSGKDTSLELVDLCCKYGIDLVICPTNFTNDEIKNIANKALLNEIGIVYAPTLTLGINAIITFVKIFSSLFPDFSFEIIEKHSKFKPIPTKTSEIISKCIYRETVPINSIRLDGYVGVHEIIATNGNERITFTHESFSRNAFANGALLAAEYIHGKVGLFDIKDMYAEMLRR